MTAPSRITLSAALKALKSAGIPIGRVEVEADKFTIWPDTDSTEPLSDFDQWEAGRANQAKGRSRGQAQAR